MGKIWWLHWSFMFFVLFFRFSWKSHTKWFVSQRTSLSMHGEVKIGNAALLFFKMPRLSVGASDPLLTGFQNFIQKLSLIRLKAIHYIRLDNALHEFIILEEKKVKNFWFWPGFEPAIFRLEGHWGNHYTVAPCYWSSGDL